MNTEKRIIEAENLEISERRGCYQDEQRDNYLI